MRTMIVLLLAGVGMPPVIASGVDTPECERLEIWAGKLNPGETVSLAPKVEVSSLLKDELIVPLFGSSVSSWEAKDINNVRRTLNQCRSAASKRKDKQASDELYKAIKAIDASRGALNQMLRVRTTIPQQVQWLLQIHPNPNLPGLLALAQDALQGKDIDLQARGVRRRPEWLSSLQQAPEYLPSSEVAPLVERLAARQADLDAEFQGAKDKMAEAKQEMARVPISPEGLSMLDQLSRSPELEKLPSDEREAFHDALQKKRWAIQQALRQQEMQQAAMKASQPIVITTRLEKLLLGSEVEDVSIRGLRPGISYEQAKQLMEQKWGFGSGIGGDIMQEFSPTRRDMANYTEKERRDGGRFELDTMKGEVGQVKFIENYTGLLRAGDTYAWLKEQFGEPEELQKDVGGLRGIWADGDSFLEVHAGNRVTGPRSGRTYKSSIELILWNRDYEKYLEDAKQQCKNLMHKPASQLSIADKQALLRGCKSP